MAKKNTLLNAAKQLSNPVQPGRRGKVGYDNVRQSIDPHIISKSVTTKETETESIYTPHATGDLTIGKRGGINNHFITFSFDSLGGATNLTTDGYQINMTNGGLQFNDDVSCMFGSETDCIIKWTTLNNDSLQVGVTVGSAAGSGYVSLMEKADIGGANRSPSGTSANPVLRVYSADATQANDYVEMFHDQNKGRISNGTGSFQFDSASSLIFNAISGKFAYMDSDFTCVNLICDVTFDQVILGLEDDSGNHLIIANDAVSASDFDHATQTNPTLYIHSDTDPNSDNTQWGSLVHDQSNFLITCGKGDIKLGDILHIPVMPTLTTTERNNLTAVNGMIIYNSTTTQMEAYFGGAWGAI